MNDRGQSRTQPVGDWLTSEAKDLADATRRRLDDAKRDAKDYTAQATESVREEMEQAGQYAEGALRRARDTMADYRERGVRTVTRDLSTYVREQPMTALLVAAGIGLTLGWLGTAARR